MSATAVANTLISSGIRRIDGKVVGNNALYTTDVTKGIFIPTTLIVSVEAATSLTVSPVLHIGTNAPDFDNIYSATLSGLSSQGKTKIIPISTEVDEIQGSTPIYMRIATGATATTYLLNVSLVGFYQPDADKKYTATATAPLRYGTAYYTTGDTFIINEGDANSYTGLITLGEEVAS